MSLFGTSSVRAATCEENFGTRGDPRNGAEFFTKADVPDVTVDSAIGQLRGIAAADGFRVHAESMDADRGALAIEQTRGRPFLIHLSATSKGAVSEVEIRTRLNQGAKAKAEDIRGSMCAMIARIKPGRDGEALATSARGAAAATDKVIEVKAITLAREVDSVAKRQTTEIVSARYQGKRYRLDGTVKIPLENGGTIELWYDTFNEGNLFMPSEIGAEATRAQVICAMAADQMDEAKNLRSGEYARLTGRVLGYERRADYHGLRLAECRFVR